MISDESMPVFATMTTSDRESAVILTAVSPLPVPFDSTIVAAPAPATVLVTAKVSPSTET